jgi:hypothetical protein
MAQQVAHSGAAGNTVVSLPLVKIHLGDTPIVQWRSSLAPTCLLVCLALERVTHNHFP